MFTRMFLFTILLTMSLCAFAQGVPSTGEFSKAKWVVSGGYCPVGCSEPVAAFIKAQIGSGVTLSNAEISAPFLDKCAGSVRYKYAVLDGERVALELSRGQRGDKRFTAKNLRLESPKVLTAVALCSDGGSDTVMARIISIEPGKVRILFEEQSVIELR